MKLGVVLLSLVLLLDKVFAAEGTSLYTMCRIPQTFLWVFFNDILNRDKKR